LPAASDYVTSASGIPDAAKFNAIGMSTLVLLLLKSAVVSAFFGASQSAGGIQVFTYCLYVVLVLSAYGGGHVHNAVQGLRSFRGRRPELRDELRWYLAVLQPGSQVTGPLLWTSVVIDFIGLGAAIQATGGVVDSPLVPFALTTLILGQLLTDRRSSRLLIVLCGIGFFVVLYAVGVPEGAERVPAWAVVGVYAANLLISTGVQEYTRDM
jgi:hypothetical protein